MSVDETPRIPPYLHSHLGAHFFIGLFVAFSVLFPFVPRLLDRDLQPIYLIFLFLWITISAYTKMSKKVLVLSVLAVLIIIYRTRFGYDIYDLSRGFVFYLTPILMIVYMRNLNQSETHSLMSLARAALYVYVAFGFVQYLGLNALNILDPARMTADRGVASFCPEPSMFGFVLTAIAIFLSSTQRLRTSDFAVYVAGMLMCGAASAILTAIPLVFGVVYELASRSRYKLFYGFALITFLVTTVVVSTELLPARILSLLSFRGELTDFSDFSVLERIGHVYFVFFQNNPLTGGAAPWGAAYSAFIGQNDIFRFGSDVNNILTSLGAVVYDGGVFGIAFIYFLYRFSDMRKLGVYSRASIFFLAIQSMSFAVPVLWLAAFSGLMKKD